MNILDDLTKIKKPDQSVVYQSIELLDKQCWDAWQKVQAIKIPTKYSHFKNIVVCGMGGSALGAHVIQSLYQNELAIPLIIHRNYSLPKFATQDSLVILSSYSGNTEEVLSSAREAIKKKLKCFVISSNGELEKLAQENKFPSYLINPIYNPCGQPRMAVGYSIFSQLALFTKLNLIRLNEKTVQETIHLIKELKKQYSIKLLTQDNQAKQIAVKLEKKIPVLVTAEHLIGAGHVFNNQLNENAKHFSEYRIIPELNHHLMEGLGFPQFNPDLLEFVFINSSFYRPRIKTRFQLTTEVVEKNKIKTSSFQVPLAENKLQEVFGLISFGSFVSFYLAMQHQLDPAPIPWVDYFKESLK